MKRVIAFTLTLSMILIALCSCSPLIKLITGNDKDTESDTIDTSDVGTNETESESESETESETEKESESESETESETESESETEPIPTATIIGEDGKTQYVIVYPDNAGSKLVDAAEKLAAAINEKYPDAAITVIPSFSDWPSYWGEYEILIGDTGREESTTAFETVGGSGNYSIDAHENGRITITASGAEAYVEAIDQFISTYVDIEGSTTLEIPEGNVLSGHIDIPVREGWKLIVPFYEGGFLSEGFYSTGNGVNMSNSSAGGNMQIAYATSAADYKAYISKLVSEGYKKISEHTIGKNLYTQLKRQYKRNHQ